MFRLLSIAALVGGFLSLVVPGGRVVAASGGPKLVRVVVELKGPPAAADLNLKTRDTATRGHFRVDLTLPQARFYTGALTAYQGREISFLRAQGLALSLHYRYTSVFNGFSAVVPQNQLSALGGEKNVLAVFPDRSHPMLDDTSNTLVSSPGAWDQLGGAANAGKGVLIGDLDTGIDITNPCFKDSGFSLPPLFGGKPRADNSQDVKYTNRKVVVARAYGTDSQTLYTVNDQVGHGTATASVAACDANTPTPIGTKISGVAPGAWLAVYNIFGNPSGGAADSSILAAMNAAMLDGVDVMNMSFGGSAGAGDPKMDAEISAVDTATKAGVVSVVSAGNAGPETATVSSPATASTAIAVGASTNAHVITSLIKTEGPSGFPASISSIRAVQSTVPFKQALGPSQLVYVGLGRMPNEDPNNLTANDFAGKDLTGKIALIQRGVLYFNTKIVNAQKAGAAGAIIFDNRAELDPPVMSLIQDPNVPNQPIASIPAMAISLSDGNALLNWVNSHPDATASMDPTQNIIPEIPNLLSDYSSRGYGTNYTLKPDIVAPGSNIYMATESTTPNNQMYSADGFTMQNGTSFSAPHVTGIVALLFQKHPKWTPAQIKAVLMGTASNDIKDSETGSSNLSVLDVGAGMADAAAAVNAPAYLMPSSVSFGAVNAGYGGVTQTQNLSLNDLTGTGGTWNVRVDPVTGNDAAAVTAPASVTVTPGGSASLPLKLSVGTASKPGDYNGYVSLTRGSITIRAPYVVHVSNEAVTQNSVLVIDGSNTNFVSTDPTKPLPAHVDYSKYYTQALTDLGKPYTLWSIGAQGDPMYADIKRASSVIYFTGDNLGSFAPQNQNVENLQPPIDGTLEVQLRQYVDGGGDLFYSGRGAALAAFNGDWQPILLGAVPNPDYFSLYDNVNSDKKQTGGGQPPSPSAVPDTSANNAKSGTFFNPYVFSGMKFDFSNKGDGAKNNTAIVSSILPEALGTTNTLFGVPGLQPIYGNGGSEGHAYGYGAMRTTDLRIAPRAGLGQDVAVVSSDEPTFKHQAKYPGRTVEFSFGFESLNSNTGFATRDTVLRRIFQYFGDKPAATVKTVSATHGHPVKLLARLKSGRIVQAGWQVGSAILPMKTKTTTYTFKVAGTYRVRAEVMDQLGHRAITPWKTIKVH